MEPKISLIAYKDLGQGKKIFVSIPNETNRWMKTDLSVAISKCKNCHAMVGEPCFTVKHFNDHKAKKYSGTVCTVRRKGG